MTETVVILCQMPGQPKPQEDKRSRKDLEAFLLGLITRGLKTPYDFMMSAGISPGASIPALSRLEASGYVRKGEGGARNRQEYVITPKGEAFLERSWRGLFQSAPSKDLEVVLRTASLALLLGQPKRAVADYLARASELRKAGKKKTPVRLGSTTAPGEVFLWMRQVASAGRVESEATVLRKLASSVRRLK